MYTNLNKYPVVENYPAFTEELKEVHITEEPKKDLSLRKSKKTIWLMTLKRTQSLRTLKNTFRNFRTFNDFSASKKSFLHFGDDIW